MRSGHFLTLRQLMNIQNSFLLIGNRYQLFIHVSSIIKVRLDPIIPVVIKLPCKYKPKINPILNENHSRRRICVENFPPNLFISAIFWIMATRLPGDNE